MCEAPKIVMNFSRCSGGYTDVFHEDEDIYDIGWNSVVSAQKPAEDSVEDAFRYYYYHLRLKTLV